LGVYYLGHEQATVAVAPRAVLDKILVAENTGHSTSELHTLQIADDGRADSLVESHRLDGLITTPLLSQGRRVAALSDAGAVLLVELGTGTGRGAVTQIAARPGSSREPLAEFGYLDSDHVWTADSQLAKLAIQPTDNRLQVRNLDQDFAGDVFDAPLERVGDELISVRRPRGGAGFRVAAVGIDSGRQLWQTELASPLAAPPVVDARGSRITALTASGSAYSLDRQAMASRIADSAEVLSSTTKGRLEPLDTGVDLDEGRIAAGAVGSKMLVHFRPDDPRGGLDAIALPAPLAAPLVRWQGGFVAASKVGQVYFYDGADGQPLADAFQPTLAPAAEFRWLEPAVYGTGASSQLVLSDGVESIYLVERLSDPQPHLAAQQVAALVSTVLTTRLAVAGDRAFAGTAGGSIASFQLPDLAAQQPVDVGAPLVWGPYAVGEQIVCTTANDELVCLDASTKILWKQPLEHGPAVGAPLADGASMLVAWQAGGLSQIELADGNERAHLDLAETLATGPVPFSTRLLLGAADGTVLVTNRPE
jgi:outer membrane protein assembly factor BamB